MGKLRTAIAAHTSGFSGRFWWIWAGAFVSALATFVFLFLAIYLTARGFNPQQVGLIVSCFGLGSLAAGPVGGTLADRMGRRPTLLGALLGSAASSMLLGLARRPAIVVAGVFGFGIFATSVFPALFAAIADVVPEADRPRAFGLLYWANNVGISVSAIAGGVVVGRHGWLPLFVVDAATTLLFAAIVWRRVPETMPASAKSKERAPAPVRGWETVLADRAFVAFVAVFLVFLTVFFQFQASLPIAMTRNGLTPSQVGRVLAVNGILIGTLQPFATWAVGRRDSGRVLALGALLVGAGYGAYALCSAAPQYAAATAVWTLGEIATFPTAVALVSRMAPAGLRGRYNGAYSLAFGAGQTLAPIAGGSVLAKAGTATLFGGCLAACSAVAACHLALGARRAHPAPWQGPPGTGSTGSGSARGPPNRPRPGSPPQMGRIPQSPRAPFALLRTRWTAATGKDAITSLLS
ncbi:MAG TPA: MFS transporter [Anaeromyxobacteraceae bacterium]|nr:MFS transporter [Anaeromyxobacteraceae bacterium]